MPRRLRGALDGPAGEVQAIGGKTGTGDNRLNTYSARGAQTGSKVINRTATFVFFLGERHFGTITAFAPAPYAEKFHFTRALPVQIVKLMAPLLVPTLHPASGSGCVAPDEETGVSARQRPSDVPNARGGSAWMESPTTAGSAYTGASSRTK